MGQETAKKVKSSKVVSVENIPSLDINALKERLQKKIVESKSSRNYSEYRLAKRKEKRKEKETKKTKIVKSVKVNTSILDEKPKPKKENQKSKNANIQFSKF